MIAPKVLLVEAPEDGAAPFLTGKRVVVSVADMLLRQC